MTSCESCENGDEQVKDSDPVSIRLLLPRYNRFEIHELHYLLSGLMLATTGWMAFFIIAFLFGVIKLGG